MHLVVRHHQVGLERLRGLKSLLAVRGGGHLVARVSEFCRHDENDVRFIVTKCTAGR